MNTSDGENVEQFGATTEALTEDKVQDDAERGPVETDVNDEPVFDAAPVEAKETEVEQTTTTTEHVEGRRNEDLPTEIQGESLENDHS